MDKRNVADTLQKKIAHAKGIDRDFVYLPVWQAKQVLEYITPMKPRKTDFGFRCDSCGHKLVHTLNYTQKHCDECGQLIEWRGIEYE